MQLRTISYLVATLAVGACGTAPDPDAVDPQSEELRKKDGGRKCNPNSLVEGSPCGNGGRGRNDAGKGSDDDDDDDDDGGRGGVGGGKRDR